MNVSGSTLGPAGTSSFRDPAGRVFLIGDRIIRLVNKTAVPDLKTFLGSKTAETFTKASRLVATEILEPEAASTILGHGEFVVPEGSMFVEHERLPFQNFPYEWPPEMLHSAAGLTLDLAESLLDVGLGLKDATPYNILFRGPQPVFVDLLSFEQRNPGDPIWLPQAQFERTFLLPLLVNKYFNLQLDQLLSVRRDGLEPEDVYRLCGPMRRFFPPFVSLVSIPAFLGARHNQDNQAIYKSKILDNVEKAHFILRSTFKRLRRMLNKVEPRKGRSSVWSEYSARNNNYSEEHLTAKTRFIERAMAEFKPKTVLDVGCNTGPYSVITAKSGAHVVAIDIDAVVVGETWRRSCAEGLEILPLVVNLTRPTPAIGWRNSECAAFLDRARGAFDAVLMLAVVHHMLVTERIPLDEIIDLAHDLTNDILVIEFIAREDPMFKRLARGRDELFTDLSTQRFETSCSREFEIVSSEHIGATRRLYLLRKRGTRANA